MTAELKNRYYGLRHGQSQANLKGLVVSDPAIGTVDYGLSEHGRMQVRQSVLSFTDLGSDTVIYCSDFKRAYETAILAQELLESDTPNNDIRLRERFFGTWDMQANTDYETVWAMDKVDPTHTNDSVESVATVCERLRNLIQSIEREHDDRNILFVSHGDPLQLLQTVFENRSPSEHRSLEHWEVAEVRGL